MSGKFIETVYTGQLTQDHLASQYFILIDFSKVKKLDAVLSSIGDSLFLFRQDGDFQVPSLKLNMKTFYYKGMSYQKRIPKDVTDKKFDISFRLDKYTILYKLLHKIYTFSYDYSRGGRESKNSNLLAKVIGLIKSDLEYRMDIKVFTSSLGEVVSVNPLLYTTNYFSFQGCQLEDLSIDSFSHSSGEPTKVKATFVYDFFEPIILDKQKKRDSYTL